MVTKRLIGLHGDTAAVRSVLAAQRTFVIELDMTPSEIGSFCDRGRDAAANAKRADLTPLPKDADKRDREARAKLLKHLARQRTDIAALLEVHGGILRRAEMRPDRRMTRMLAPPDDDTLGAMGHDLDSQGPSP